MTPLETLKSLKEGDAATIVFTYGGATHTVTGPATKPFGESKIGGWGALSLSGKDSVLLEVKDIVKKPVSYIKGAPSDKPKLLDRVYSPYYIVTRYYMPLKGDDNGNCWRHLDTDKQFSQDGVNLKYLVDTYFEYQGSGLA